MGDPLHVLKSLILRSDSLTETLRLWCEKHGIGSGPLRSTHAPNSGRKPASAEAIAALRLRSDETTRHRGITLMRGEAELLDADNWYVPERLPKETNELLETADTPFGAALLRGGQTRETLFLGSTQADLDAMRRRETAAAWNTPILRVRAIVVLSGVPVAFVEERLRPQLITDAVMAPAETLLKRLAP